MGFRFRRTVKIFPGVRVNLSRSGLSTSIGVRGAHVTVGHGKVRETVGLPGSGLSYTTTQSTRKEGEPRHALTNAPADALPEGNAWRGWLWIILAVLFALILVRWLVSVL
ncbi:MAG TPA: DUF4236 domain-containing protein [Candidatus Binataceae bacterium]|nr:DUF4236 domain-containing protein [Candidatus Binataceae bacterium]